MGSPVLVRSRRSEHSAEARGDLEADVDDLIRLARSARTRLTRLLAELERIEVQLYPATAALIRREAARAAARHHEHCRGLAALHEEPLARLAEGKRAYADLLRVEQATLSALVTAADWQSPSFGHSLRGAAGRDAGRITPHVDDYKRDRFHDAAAYEAAFAREMVDAGDVRALLTSCGMAAFTTILELLRSESPVALGRELYHETKELLLRACEGRAVEVDERDVSAIAALRPRAVFVDSLSNTPALVVPDLAAIAAALDHDAYLVVDNTGLSSACQPFSLHTRARVIVFESLLKHPQLGLDRTNAGVILARDDDADRLDHLRERLGTIISDVAVAALPEPDRDILDRRLARLRRNASILAERLGAAYPGVGSYLVLDPGRDLEEYVQDALAEARRAGVHLLVGTSFGFDTTRIYVTGAKTDVREPFLRISAGTEDRLAIETVAAALARALRI